MANYHGYKYINHDLLTTVITNTFAHETVNYTKIGAWMSRHIVTTMANKPFRNISKHDSFAIGQLGESESLTVVFIRRISRCR
jgi:hypothetical protein